MSRPPLLTEEGNTAYSNQFVHTFIGRAYGRIGETYIIQQDWLVLDSAHDAP